MIKISLSKYNGGVKVGLSRCQNSPEKPTKSKQACNERDLKGVNLNFQHLFDHIDFLGGV